MANIRLTGIHACVFDAYGTLFDVNSAAAQAKNELAEKWQPLADLWRAKQLQYTWLRGLMGKHVDFWQVTQDALDYAMASLKFDDPPLRARLMDLYLRLRAYPEVKDTLSRLKAAGMKLAILSNGEPRMLAASTQNFGLADILDAILPVSTSPGTPRRCNRHACGVAGDCLQLRRQLTPRYAPHAMCQRPVIMTGLSTPHSPPNVGKDSTDLTEPRSWQAST